ncbi:hypothetical protein AB4Z52_33175 [Rhizobium sp. 2YAF20]|uniref:hypothetical protein n=1 Tax=Rhizobium sp. 2YAF20 TaxID=3233027 RepID=UPI003F94520D
MKVWAMLSTIALFTVLMQNAADANGNVGVRQIVAPSKERGVNLDVTVWYPAQAGGEAVLLGDSALFVGTPAMRDA